LESTNDGSRCCQWYLIMGHYGLIETAKVV
jgi:hypothetical protein